MADKRGIDVRDGTSPNGRLNLLYQRHRGKVAGGVLMLGNWRGGDFQLPAVCSAADCDEAFASGVPFGPGQNSARVSGLFTCPKCGSAAHVPDPLVIDDGSGHTFELRRLQLLTRTIQVARGLSAADLQEAARILGEIQLAGAGPTAVQAAKRNSSDQVRSVLDLVPQTRQDYYGFLGLIVAVLALIISVIAFTADDEEVTRVVVEQTIEKHPEALAPHQGTVRLPPKVSRSAPCPCGSGLKHKRCCLPASEGAVKLPPGQARETDAEQGQP